MVNTKPPSEYLIISILVGGFKHFLFFFSIVHGTWDVILPIDELIFSRRLLHHQPDNIWENGYIHMENGLKPPTMYICGFV